MKHLIIGAGIVGTATGIWLQANKEEVIFCDISKETLQKLQNRGFQVTSSLQKKTIDIFWICTVEWDTEQILQQLAEGDDNPTIVIRSTMPPGSTEGLIKKYHLTHVAHIPEFLRQKTAIADEFDTDRIILGTNDKDTKRKITKIFSSVTSPIIYCSPTESELIKYASNCWLSTQISYWNEIKVLCDTLHINPQLIANAACLDKRISKYGTAMTGDPYAGFCFPKDMKALIKAFEDRSLKPILLKAVEKRNEMVNKQKKH